ncbi:hypothetical protein REPUB_Repub15cG0089800 [Reevesia pubescens]
MNHLFLVIFRIGFNWLGLGAKVRRQSKVGPSNNPVERKLYANLNSGKRKAFKNRECTNPSRRDRVDEDDDDDEDEYLDSRSSAEKSSSSDFTIKG